ncbi:MAG TPA: hypothetical protein VMN36_18130 [Verrucomicrobiales bacterium]|nr:hypothetical protein [Verrucomicrobiales bacterium]
MSFLEQSPSVAICGVAELQARAKAAPSHLLSIWHDQAEASWETWVRELFPHSQIHFCRCNDVHYEDAESRPPARKDMEGILAFTRALEPSDSLVIHCAAGISRSTAAAFAHFCQNTDPGQEQRCLEHVIALRPCGRPNRMLVYWADAILNREGRMLAALENWIASEPVM